MEFVLLINSLWPIGTILPHISRSTLPQTMACCLIPWPPSHYLNWCRFNISQVLLHSPKANFTWKCLRYQFVQCIWKMLFENYFAIFQRLRHGKVNIATAFPWDVIAHPCHEFTTNSAKLPLNLVMVSHYIPTKHDCDYLFMS